MANFFFFLFINFQIPCGTNPLAYTPAPGDHCLRSSNSGHLARNRTQDLLVLGPALQPVHGKFMAIMIGFLIIYPCY